jgi:uncharacterized protein YndB with AHSA1/START domain
MEHEVWLDADRESVFAALTTRDGLDGWWGKAVIAEPRVGTVVEFDHGLGAPLRMQITDLVPNERLTWKCISEFADPSNPASEWTGQTLQFEVSPRGAADLLGGKRDVTVLRLRVTGWPPQARWYSFCNTAWGQTLSVNLANSLSNAKVEQQDS